MALVFSSSVFLFFFLPCVLGIYYLLRRRRGLSNAFLTLASLAFYAWGEPSFVFVMCGSIVLNWLFGLWVDRVRGDRRRENAVIAVMAVTDLGLLAVFKYLMFLMRSVNWAFGLHLPVPEIALPIGISFFTFQAMSYVIDVRRGKGEVQRSLINVAFYIAFFPQLIAGPIVRYETVAAEITGRRENWADFSSGGRRFLVGLCKKVLLANNIGLLTDSCIALTGANRSVMSAWLGAFAFMLQVYFDFSGYSDMAIGLGRMFGFHFLENFNYPFISRSISEFWRRWHMSLTTWFRDYVYFPLGGSRVKNVWLLLRNMFVVWFLTGMWHGADVTYVLWGVLCFLSLAVERVTGLGKWMEKHFIGHFYTVILVVAATCLVPCVDFENAKTVYSAMFGLGGVPFWNPVTTVMVREYGLYFLLGWVCAMPWLPFLRDRLRIPEAVLRTAGAAALIVLSLVSVCMIATDSYNPFIYFNF